VSRVKLSFQQKQELITNGFVKIPGVVPKVMVKEARKAINHSIGKGIPADHKGANYCDELMGERVITDLFNHTPAKAICDSLIGHYHPVGGGQIALRFPTYFEGDPPKDLGAHLDGMLQLHEGIVHNFTALVGVLLSDQPEPYAGNFTVYPGTHRLYESYFREKGPDVILEEEAFKYARSPNVPLPDPVQIIGEAGDLVIAHYQTIHAGGLNISDSIRYSIYFRVDHVDRHKDWRAPLTNMWLHWPGLQS